MSKDSFMEELEAEMKRQEYVTPKAVVKTQKNVFFPEIMVAGKNWSVGLAESTRELAQARAQIVVDDMNAEIKATVEMYIKIHKYSEAKP